MISRCGECLAGDGLRSFSISPNGSPFDWPKPDQRMNVAVARVTETGLPLIYLNQVGGQDELVFDGASFVLNADLSSLAVQPAGLGGGVDRSSRMGRRTSGGWRCEPGPCALLLEEQGRGGLSRLHAGLAGLRRHQRIA